MAAPCVSARYRAPRRVVRVLCVVLCLLALSIACWRPSSNDGGEGDGEYGAYAPRLRGLGLPEWTKGLKETDVLALTNLVLNGVVTVDELKVVRKEFLRAVLPRPLTVNRIWDAYKTHWRKKKKEQEIRGFKSDEKLPPDPLGDELDRFRESFRITGPGEEGPRRGRVSIEEPSSAPPSKGTGKGGRGRRQDPDEERDREQERAEWEAVNRIREMKEKQHKSKGWNVMDQIEQPENYYDMVNFQAKKDDDEEEEGLPNSMDNNRKKSELEEEALNRPSWKKKSKYRRRAPKWGLNGDPLDLNVTTRSGNTEFFCSWPGCEKIFGSADKMVEHYTAHGLQDEEDPDNLRERRVDDVSAQNKEKIQSMWLKEAGNHRFRQGLFEEAEKLYSEAIELDSTQHVFFVNRANARYKLGNFTGSLADAQQAVTLCRTFGKAHYRMAEALMELGHYKLAADAYVAGSQCDGNDGAKHLWQAKAREATKQFLQEQRLKEARERPQPKTVDLPEEIVLRRPEPYVSAEDIEEHEKLDHYAPNRQLAKTEFIKERIWSEAKKELSNENNLEAWNDGSVLDRAIEKIKQDKDYPRD